MHSLLPPPRGVRLLSNDESARLARLNPSAGATCPTCQGRRAFRWYRHAARGFDAGSEDPYEVVTFDCTGVVPCDDQRILTKFLWNAGLGLAYQRLSWEDAKAMEQGARDCAHEYLWRANDYVNAGVGFILHGEVGNGKTMLASLILKTLLGEGYDGYFTTFSELIDIFMSAWRDPEEKAWFYRRIKGAGILVIDDVGREHKQRRLVSMAEAEKTGRDPGLSDYPTSVAESVFDEVIRHRVGAARPTIVTTNFDLKRLTEGYGGNVMSLLAERCTDYRMIGGDFRPVAKARLDEEVVLGLNRPVVMG